MAVLKSLLCFASVLPLTLWGVETAFAQSIVPARDGTQTQVNRQDNRFNIDGGQRSGDGANLFHSFDRFGLTREEVANFQSRPDLQNILVRVVGGDASVINGSLQMSGGNSHLFLMNPAGIIFGEQARLDLPAAFTATTASGIGFEGGWFGAMGGVDYSALVGQPSSFAFALSQPGAIANFGSLSVGEGQAINLLGGSVVSAGTLNAPNGQITVTAVSGSSRVRLSQPGSPLSIEVTPGRDPLTALSLPMLLTGGSGGSAEVSGTVNAGVVAVVGDRVTLTDATIHASSPSGGGTVLIGGSDRGQGLVPNAITTTVNANTVIHADALGNGDGGRVVIWSDQVTSFLGTITARGGATGGNGGFVEVSGRSRLNFRGLVDTSAIHGAWGSLLLDPRNVLISETIPFIVLADDSVISPTDLGSQKGKVTVEATNNITLDSGVTLDFGLSGTTDGISFIADSDLSGGGDFIMGAGSQILTNGRSLEITGANITAQDITTGRLSGARSGDLTLTALGGDIVTGTINTSNTFLRSQGGGNVTIRSEGNTPGDISVASIDTQSGRTGAGGDVTLVGDLVQVRDTLSGGISINAQGGKSGGESGSINITHGGGANNIAFVIGDSDASKTGNGTVGGISSGGETINSGSLLAQIFFPVAASGGRSSPTSNITITSVNNAPSLEASPNTQTITLNGGATAVRIPAKFDVSDRNGDTVALVIVDLPTGARLTRNGVALANGSPVSAGEILEFTPNSSSGVGDLAFKVAAVDLTDGTFPLAQSDEVHQVLTTTQTSTPPTVPPIIPTGVPIGVPTEVFPTVPAVVPGVSESNPVPVITTSLSTGMTFSADPESIMGTDLTVLEEEASQDFESYLRLDNTSIKSPTQARDLALDIERSTGAKPALVYINFVPEGTGLFMETKQGDNDPLELTIVSAKGMSRQRVTGVTRSQFMAISQTFRSQVTDPRLAHTRSYLPAAQQLYQWVIAPIATQLTEQKISNLVFIPDAGVRAIPYAALHDGKQFLVENYSIGLMPSLSLTDTNYTDIHNSQVLAIGISESTQGALPLPAVPTELATLMQLWRRRGTSFLNSNATLENLKSTRQAQPYGIIHMATHANFVAGTTDKSYIQLWNERLQIDQIRQLGWNDPPVEMLVLSACRTALGDVRSELGFAGLAVQAGVKTVVASLWYVSDSATTALMAKFYEQLNTAPIKADALRQAQVAMAQGKVYIADGRLMGVEGMEETLLPLGIDSAQDFSHPYYWASFTMVGNPW